MEKTGVTRLQAQKSINAWLAQCGGDVQKVLELLDWAHREKFTGHSFGGMIQGRADAIEREQKRGMPLPYGPVRKAIRGGQG